MNNIQKGESQKCELIPGQKNSLRVNKPVRFEIKTVGGTTISGTIIPNNPLDVTPGDDIVSYNVYIEDDLLSPVSSY